MGMFGGNRIVSGVSIPSIAAPTVIGGAGAAASGSTQPNNPTTFVPTNINGLAAWLDFSGLYSTLTDAGSGKLSQITDGSGSGNTFAQSTAGKRPTITANASANTNSSKSNLQAVRFVRGGSGCNVNCTFASDITAFSWFIVWRPITVTTNDGIFCSQSSGAGGDAGAASIEISNTGSGRQIDVYGSGTGYNTGYGATGAGTVPQNYIQICQLDYNGTTGKFRTSAGYFGNFPDGAAVSKAGLKFPHSAAVTVGNNASNTMNADIYAILLYSSALSSYDSARVFTFLATQYGLPYVETQFTQAAPIAQYDFSGTSSTVSVTGGLINSVTDFSGNGYTASSTGTHRPTQNAAASPTGLNTAQFAHSAGSPIYLASSDLNLTNDITDRTTYYVIRPTTVSANDQFGGSNSNRDNCVGHETDSTGSGNSNKVEEFFDGIAAQGLTANNTFVANTGYILIYNYKAARAGNSYTASLTIYVCSGNTGLGSAVTGTSSQKFGFYSAHANYAGNNSLIIGGDPSSNGNLTLQGDIGEIWVYATSHDTTTMESNRASLQTKWGWG